MRIAVMTSGGDAPGMNAAIRCCVVTALARGHEILGIRRGYDGLIDGEFVKLDYPSVESISRMGGTILGSGRSRRFPTSEGQRVAIHNLKERGVEGMIVIGGNGSLTGATILANHPERDGAFCVVGIPASIDNDIGHTDLSIGADTAVNTAVLACDRILDTARAHRRAFLVEVMGRKCGFLAMRAGISAEADAILHGEKLPDEPEPTEEEIVAYLEGVLERCFSMPEKNRALIIKAEGVEIPTTRLTKRLQEFLDRCFPGIDIRATILGHVVRGGAPTSLDRVIAQRLAIAAVHACEKGYNDVMMAWKPPQPVGTVTAIDESVSIVPIPAVLEETKRLQNGTSPVVRRRIELLRLVQEGDSQRAKNHVPLT